MSMSLSMPRGIFPQLCRALIIFGLAMGLVSEGIARAGGAPEDDPGLKGKIIISDSRLPTSWSSVGQFVSKLKSSHKSSLTYDKKTGKIQIYYAAFFLAPVNDLEVNFVVYDITDPKAPNQKGKWEAFLNKKGERVLFNSIELDKEEFEMNKKYRFVIEYRRKPLATGEFKLLGEGPKYSGKVEFTEEEVKKKE